MAATLCPGCFIEKGKIARCLKCGYDENEQRNPRLLPHRTIIGQKYLIGKMIDQTESSRITYLAWDLDRQRIVTIQEYFPKQLVKRNPNDVTIALRSPMEEATYKEGLKTFLNATANAQKGYPQNTQTFFEENNTAYIVLFDSQTDRLKSNVRRAREPLFAEKPKSVKTAISEEDALEVEVLSDEMDVIHNPNIPVEAEEADSDEDITPPSSDEVPIYHNPSPALRKDSIHVHQKARSVTPAQATAEEHEEKNHVSHSGGVGRIHFTDKTGNVYESLLNVNLCKVGRFEDSDVQIPDESVSRNHAEIEIKDGRFWISDLGSINRTRLNGKLVKNRRELNHGDQIQFGDIQARFLAPSHDEDVTPDEASASTKYTRSFWIGWGIVLGCVILISIFFYLRQPKIPNLQQMSQPGLNTGSPKDPSELFLQANERMEQGKWEAAKRILEEVRDYYPLYTQEAEKRIHYLHFERANEVRLELAKELIAKGDEKNARLRLKEITSTSRYYLDAQTLVAEIEHDKTAPAVSSEKKTKTTKR